MKPEFPYLNAHVSRYIATPLIAITAFTLTVSTFGLPAKEVYPMVFSVFGISAALSGICFTLAVSPTNESSIKYAGEKFLHSSLLLIQSIAIVFVKSEILSSSFIKSSEIRIEITSIVFVILFTYVSSVAWWSFYYGFKALNDDLWPKYKKRIEGAREAIEEHDLEKNKNAKK